MATASAPGKVILIGEHFVVEDEPAIAVAVDLRARVSVEALQGDFRIIVESPGLRACTVFKGKEEEKGDVLYPVFYAARSAMQRIGAIKPLYIRVESDIPPAAGMGSSAAVAVATVAATMAELGREIDEEDVSRIAYLSERIVHGKPSGIDNTISTYGGAIAYRKSEGFIRLQADFSPISLVLSDSGIPRSTGEMVAKVRSLKERYPTVMDPLYHAAGRLAIEVGKALERGDFQTVGDLMNINHGLLSAVGVSNMELERLVHASRKLGALGAKITGAGGGGFVVALCWREDEDRIMGGLRKVSERVMATRISEEGVIVER